MEFLKCTIGLGIAGSFCMLSSARKEIERLTEGTCDSKSDITF